MHAWVAEIRRSATSCAVLLALLFATRSDGQTSLLVGPSQLKGDGVAVDEAAPALAFGRYLASIQNRNPFTELGPIGIEIEASIPGLDKQGSLFAIRQTGASELGEYTINRLDGDTLVKQQVIARYLEAEKQAERIPILPSLLPPRIISFTMRGPWRLTRLRRTSFRLLPERSARALFEGRSGLTLLPASPSTKPADS
jgi:hypothetical protein